MVGSESRQLDRQSLLLSYLLASWLSFSSLSLTILGRDRRRFSGEHNKIKALLMHCAGLIMSSLHAFRLGFFLCFFRRCH